MSTDFWGDDSIREHLRSQESIATYGQEQTEQVAEPVVEQQSLDDALDQMVDTEVEETTDPLELIEGNPFDEEPVEEQVEETTETVDETVPEQNPERDTFPDVHSNRAKVLAVLKEFAPEFLKRADISAALEISPKQVTCAVDGLRGSGYPIHRDGHGSYSYDETKTVILAPSSQKPRPRPKREGGYTLPPYTSELLQQMSIHDRAVLVYEALDRHREAGSTRCRVASRDALTAAELKHFPNKSILTVIHRYLAEIGSIISSGPIKRLQQHPNETPESLRAESAARINAEYRDKPAPWIRSKEVRQQAPVSQPVSVEPHMPERVMVETQRYAPVETAGIPEMIEAVDEDRLASAIANGMWSRYEWALTELGKTQEVIASLQEAVRHRDEEITRLRGYLAEHLNNQGIKDVARSILTAHENGGR